MGFPGGPVVKNPPASAGDTGSVPAPGVPHTPWRNSPRATLPSLLVEAHTAQRRAAPALCSDRKPVGGNEDPMQLKEEINKK